jgi:hypothetical protein
MFANPRKTCPEIFPRSSTAAALENNGFLDPATVSDKRLTPLVKKKSSKTMMSNLEAWRFASFFVALGEVLIFESF